MTIPSAGGTIAFLGEDAHGWDFKVQKALDHATSLWLTSVPLEPAALAELVIVSSEFIDSPLMRRLRSAGTAVVESKVFLEAQRGRALPGKRWGESPVRRLDTMNATGRVATVSLPRTQCLLPGQAPPPEPVPRAPGGRCW